MSVMQCTYAALNTMSQPIRRLLWGTDQSGYYSKTLQMVQHSRASRPKTAIMYYCHPPMPETSQCTLTATQIIFYVLIFLFTIALLYLLTKMLPGKYQHFKYNQTTASALIDEMEVELATIDSIDEFEKMTGTSEEGISENQRHQFLQHNTSTVFKTATSYGQGIIAVYSLISQPIKNMFLNSSGNENKSTNGREAHTPPKRPSPPHSNRKDTHSPRRGRGSAKNQAPSEMPKRIGADVFKRGTVYNPSERAGVNSQLPRSTGGKKLKDCSVNTEIRFNNLSFTSVEKTSDNETDLEKELALMDAPGKYYYAKCRKESGPCNVFNKRRKHSRV